MAKDESFDIVSEVDMQEVDNAVQQADRQIAQRFDLKDTKSEVTLDKHAATITRARRGPHTQASRRAEVPDLSQHQPLEQARGPAATAPALGGDRVRGRALGYRARRLRLGPLRGPAHRHPLPRGLGHAAAGAREVRVRVRVGQGPLPDPPGVPIEGGRSSDGDRHVIVVDRSRCRLYELYAAYPLNGGAQLEGRLGRDLEPALEPPAPAWTSADAAGLPILPGLARYDEVRRGRIDHALRITVPRTRRAFIYPARHFASDSGDPDLPAMGQRVRLRRASTCRGFPRQSRVVLRALKRYGTLVADNGSAWYVSGAPSPRAGTTTTCTRSGACSGSDFEVVDTGRLPRP